MSGYINGVVSVTTSATLLTTVAVGGTLVIQNNSATVPVFIGGPAVTADTTATGGVSIPISSTLAIPVSGDGSRDLWARTASSTALVGFLRI